jgi:hypothetical protein
MFRALLCPSSGICDYVVELPHWLISFLVCCVLELGCSSARLVSGLPASAGNPETHKHKINSVVFKDLKIGLTVRKERTMHRLYVTDI